MTSGDFVRAYRQIWRPQECSLTLLKDLLPGLTEPQYTFLLQRIRQRRRLVISCASDDYHAFRKRFK